MQKKMIVLILSLFMGSLFSLTAGGNSDEVTAKIENQRESITVVDALGRTVSLDKPATRIAFTHYSTAEALRVIDAWELVVGRDGFSSDSLYYPGLDEIPPLTAPMEGPFNPNMEELLELDPDLLILEIIPMPGMEELIDMLEGTIPVIAVKTYVPEEMERSFRNIGTLIDKSQQVEEYLDWHQDLRQILQDRTGDLTTSEKATLFYKTGWSGPEDLQTFTDELSYVPTRNKLSGSINVAGDLPSQGGWVAKIDPEWLTSTDYEILILGDPTPGAYGPGVKDVSILKEYREAVMAMPIFSGSTAVREGRVYMLAPEFFGTPRNIIGFAHLAKWCHPELFMDFSPQKYHQEYLSKFMDLDIDFNKQGVFTYPEE